MAMREVARRLGVSAPSLYFHFASREALVDSLIRDGIEELAGAMGEAARIPDARAVLHAFADAYLRFARHNPQLFSLVSAPAANDERIFPAAENPAGPIVLAAMSRLVREEDLIPIAGVVWSMVHGFSTLILAGRFPPPGDPTEALHRGIDLILDGLAAETNDVH